MKEELIMYLNKYGILIKKKLKEKYYNKYIELQDNGTLDDLLEIKQDEVARLKRALITGAKKTSLLFEKQLIVIQDRISEEMNSIVDELGGATINDCKKKTE